MLSINCKGRLLNFSTPVVMGIINATPDSFHSGSRFTTDAAVAKAEQMLKDGATILDIGGQSTRPGSQQSGADEEQKRALPVVEAIHKNFPEAIISIDSFYASVAKDAVHAGASIINDVSAGTMDEAMTETVATLNVPYVLMHMLGKPLTMQQDPVYKNVVTEVFDFLSFKLKELHGAGIKDVIVDPGFGFGKTIDHNFILLQHLSYFKKLNCPLLVGLSRKATIYRTLNITVEEALNGTTIINTISLLNGASILRVHDVKEAVEAIKLTERYKNGKEQQ